MNRYEALKHATIAHAGQVDKCGQPYILHPIAVASALETTEQVPREAAVKVALLHDVLEDTDHELQAGDFEDFEWEALFRVTHRPEQTYAEYIEAICEPIIQLRPGQAVSVVSYDRSRLPAFVKLADLWHNLQPERQACLPEKERTILEARYMKARDRIWEALGYRWWPDGGITVIDVATKVWVCEEGHVDDHHYTRDEPGVDELCSRCGGTCEQLSLDGLAREYRGRLRVNVGLITENKQLKDKLAGSEQQGEVG